MRKLGSGKSSGESESSLRKKKSRKKKSRKANNQTKEKISKKGKGEIRRAGRLEVCVEDAVNYGKVV